MSPARSVEGQRRDPRRSLYGGDSVHRGTEDRCLTPAYAAEVCEPEPEQVIRALRKSGIYINESSGSRFDEVRRTLDALQAEDYYDCKLSMRGNPKTFCRSTVEEVSRNWPGGSPKARN